MSTSREKKAGFQGLFRQWDGRLTRELLLAPGDFGLGKVPARRRPDATTAVTCGFCSTGCGLNIHLRENAAIGISPATDYPVNLGMACPKGWEALSVLKAEDRALTPLLRDGLGRLSPIDWDAALKVFVERFQDILRKHGPESVAFLSTGQIATEEMALLGAVAKFGMGLIHGDGNTRQCMATAVVAYKESFGFDAPPYTYADFEQSDAIVLVGSNLCVAHPILWERVCRNRRDPKIIVVDPRRTETAMAATSHLAIAPKSDLTFFNGVARVLIREGWIDRGFIERNALGFEEYQDFIDNFTPRRVTRYTGISEGELFAFAETIHKATRASFWWTMGINQSHEGVRAAQSIINLALLTGNVGKPGTGANSITGQCNAMGSRLFSNTTSLFAGRDFRNAEDRREVAEILGIPEERIPDRNSLAYDQILDGVRTGKIRGLWIVATNPAHSWIEQRGLREVFDKLDFLVVQDMYSSTETARRADLILPAAAWGEKDGTVINSERRFGLFKKVARAPGKALADFAIFKLIAAAWGCADLFEEWKDPESTFQILKRLTKGRPCDIEGIEDYRMIDELGGVQWPCPQGLDQPPVERRLFEDGRFYHPDGKARFVFEEPRDPLESPDLDYPLWLLTGRGSVAQWHTQTRTSKSAVLRKLAAERIYVEINPVNAREAQIQPNQWVVVETRRGKIKAKAVLTHSVKKGQIFIPMHYDIANILTLASFDPYSRQPSYKACAARVQTQRGVDSTN